MQIIKNSTARQRKCVLGELFFYMGCCSDKAEGREGLLSEGTGGQGSQQCKEHEVKAYPTGVAQEGGQPVEEGGTKVRRTVKDWIT